MIKKTIQINKALFKLAVISILFSGSFLYSQTPSNYYNWKMVGNLKEIIQKSPLYDSNKVWMEATIPIDTLMSGKYVHWPFPQYQMSEAKIYTRDSVTLWIGQNLIMGLIILRSTDYGENWELLYSEVLDTNFETTARASNRRIINQSFWVDSDKFIMPRYGDIFYSNLSDTFKFIEYPKPNPTDTLSAFVGGNDFSVGKDGKISALYFRGENWQPYRSFRYIITTDDFGQSWDTIHATVGYSWSGGMTNILPVDKNGDPWNNFNSLTVARQTQISNLLSFYIKHRGPNEPQMMLNNSGIEDNYTVIDNFFQQYYDDRDSIFFVLIHYPDATTTNPNHERKARIIRFEKNNSSFGHSQKIITDGLPCYFDIKHISFDSTEQFGVFAATSRHNHNTEHNKYTSFYITVDSAKTWNIEAISDPNYIGSTIGAAQTSSKTIAFMDAGNNLWFGYRKSSIKEISTITNLQVSPNPTDGTSTLTFDLESTGLLTITLNNLLGKELLELHNAYESVGTFIKSFSMEMLPIGIYYLKINHNGNIKVEKVIKN